MKFETIDNKLCPNCESYDKKCYDTRENAIKGFLASKKNGSLKKRLHIGRRIND